MGVQRNHLQHTQFLPQGRFVNRPYKALEKGLLQKAAAPCSLSKKLIVGAIIDRPQILPKQNLSPQGENTLIFLRKIRKTAFFGGRSMIAPTEFSEI